VFTRLTRYHKKRYQKRDIRTKRNLNPVTIRAAPFYFTSSCFFTIWHVPRRADTCRRVYDTRASGRYGSVGGTSG